MAKSNQISGEGFIGDGKRTEDRMSTDEIKRSLDYYKQQLESVGGGQVKMYVDILVDRLEELEEKQHSTQSTCNCVNNEKVSTNHRFVMPEVDPLTVMTFAVATTENLIQRLVEDNYLRQFELTALDLVLEMTRSNLEQITHIAKR